MDNSQMFTESIDRSDLLAVKISDQNQIFFPPICQICGQLIQIDTSIDQINGAQYKQLNYSFTTTRDDAETLTTTSDIDMEMSMSTNLLLNAGNNDIMQESTTSKTFEPFYTKSIPPRNFLAHNQPLVAFMNIQDVQYSTTTNPNSQINVNNNNNPSNEDGWSARINKISSLCDLMSLNTNIDHPLCEECADQLVNQLDAQCKVVEKELSDYTALVNRLNQQASNEKEVNDLEQELKQLEKEEQELVNKLSEAEKKEAGLVKLKEERLAEEANLMQQEQTHLLEYSNYKRQLIKLEEKQESLDNQLQNSKFHFNRLRTVNVLNATFHIWHSGPFGTINYFRLGRLPGTPVEWEEINAGLGQVNLLLYCLARKVKLEFKRYRLVPFGSFSYIQVTENTGNHKQGDQLNMYRLKGYKYYFDWDSKFDQSMIAFLDCLNQFEEKIKSMDPQFSMPYRINGYKLEDKNSSSYSIRCQFNSHEEWTKALKYMLTNLKWSLVWVSAINENAA